MKVTVDHSLSYETRLNVIYENPSQKLHALENVTGNFSRKVSFHIALGKILVSQQSTSLI